MRVAKNSTISEFSVILYGNLHTMRFLPQGVTGAANVPMDADFLFSAYCRGWIDSAAGLIRCVCFDSFGSHCAARQQN